MAAKKSSLEKTKTPGVYRRGKKYVYAYRVRGVQRWKTVDTYDEARRGKLAAEVDVERGELRDLSRASFGDYAREWIINYQGRTSNGFRGSTRRAYTQMLEARIIPYFDSRVRLRLAEIEPRDVKAFVRWMNEQEDHAVPAGCSASPGSASTSPSSEPSSATRWKRASSATTPPPASASRCRKATARRAHARLRSAP
jgi:hypothetical protein